MIIGIIICIICMACAIYWAVMSAKDNWDTPMTPRECNHIIAYYYSATVAILLFAYIVSGV